MKETFTRKSIYKRIGSKLALCLITVLVCFDFAYGASMYAVKSGDWHDPSVWAEKPNGQPGVDFPTAGDLVIIENGFEIVISGTHQECDSIIINNFSENHTRLLLVNGHLTVHGGFVMSATTANGKYTSIELIENSSLHVTGDVGLKGISNHATFIIRNDSQLFIAGDVRVSEQNDMDAEIKGFDNAVITIKGEFILSATW